MDIRQLRQFIAVAEELNFHAAAKRLKMAQPPLSQAIKRLETQLGVRLLTRSRRLVILTQAGEAFLANARRTLMQLDRTEAVARQVDAGVAGSLRIAFVGSATYSRLFEVMQAFRLEFPSVELELLESTSIEIVKLLEAEQVDIGFLRPVVGLTGRLLTETFEKDRFVACLPAGHRLAKQRSIGLDQLADDPFVIFSARRSPTLHHQILLLCRTASFTPRIAQEAQQVQTIVSLVSAGFGVALVPATVSRERDPRVAYVPLRERSPYMTIELLAARRVDDAWPAAGAFAALARRIGRTKRG